MTCNIWYYGRHGLSPGGVCCDWRLWFTNLRFVKCYRDEEDLFPSICGIKSYKDEAEENQNLALWNSNSKNRKLIENKSPILDHYTINGLKIKAVIYFLTKRSKWKDEIHRAYWKEVGCIKSSLTTYSSNRSMNRRTLYEILQTELFLATEWWIMEQTPQHS